MRQPDITKITVKNFKKKYSERYHCLFKKEENKK